MQVQDFFKQIKLPDFSFSPGVHIFYGPEFHSLFFTILKNKLKEKTNNNITFLDIKSLERNQIKSSLETTFLGLSNIFWLGDLTDLGEAEIKFWLTYFKEYSGPHTVLFFISDTVNNFQQLINQYNNVNNLNKLIFIKLEQHIDKNFYKEIYSFILNHNPETNFTEKLFSNSQQIGLDKASLLIYYQALLGKRHDLFFDSWIDKIIISEKSLFVLSQYFFAKNNINFFESWEEIKDSYSDEFWIAYWSDQIWHAIFYIQYMRFSMTQEAKSINRLPFSFIQKDWKKCDLQELFNCHKYLYKIDYNLKNSTDNNGLDLLLFKYFNNNFKN